MLVPCTICNSFYLITWPFLPCFSLSPPCLPSSWQTDNLSIQKFFLPIIGKVLKHNWKNVIIPVTMVFFSHASDTSTVKYQIEWHVCDESYLVPLNAHGRRKRESVISPTEGWQDVKHRAKWSWRIRAASFHITWDPRKDHKAHFLKIKTEEQTIFCSASILSGRELSSAELCSKIVATLPQIPEEPCCFLLSSSKRTCCQAFHPQHSSVLWGGGVGTPLQGVKRAQKPNGFKIWAQCN